YKARTKLCLEAHVSTAKGGGSVLAHVKAHVSATPEECVAYVMGSCTPVYFEDTEGEGVTTLPIVVLNNHHNVGCGRYSLPYPLKDREVVTSQIWEKDGRGSYFVAQISTETPLFPLDDERYTRMKLTRAVTITSVSATTSCVDIVGFTSLEGNIPSRVNNTFTIPANIATPMNMQRFFASIKDPASYRAETARELGLVLVWLLLPLRKNKAEFRKFVTDEIGRISVLRRAQAKYRVLDELLLNILRNEMSKADLNIRSPLASLTGNEAARIGSAFASIIVTNATPANAVDEYLRVFPAVRDLAKEFPWFVPMLSAIAQELLHDSSLGVAVRAYGTAAMSIMDQASDTYVIYLLFQEGRTGIAFAFACMIAANLLFQVLIVGINFRKKEKHRRRTIVLELLSIVTFIKHGWDAYKVASGETKEQGVAFEPLQEMAFVKNAELFSEALPGLVLQMIAFTTSATRSKAMFGSILISAGSAALISTCTTYDMDTSPVKRKESPAIYGIVPDHGRTRAFFSMFFISFLQIMARALTCALLGVTNATWLMTYLLADAGIFITYKSARRDLVYFVCMPISAAVPFSLFFRVVVKTIVDFSGNLTLRNPFEVGGTYFTFTLLTTQVAMIVVAGVYNEHAGGANKLDAALVTGGAWALSAAWAGVFLFFIAFQ
ncbi:hypothetical protein TeGR_g1628, partial [Tetraparma gracilis]